MQHDLPPSLPRPDELSASHSERVADFIRAKIEERGGSISFAEFMQHALYAPGLGYYAAGATKFGEAGDFVTAPEVSPVFGRVLARQCAEVKVEAGSVIEIGAGSGKLAADLLQAFADLDALPAGYAILEVSADLRERQEIHLREQVPDLMHLVSWLDAMPEAHRGVVVANEVLDALPFERFVRRDRGVMQQRVAAEGDRFELIEVPAPESLSATVTDIERSMGSTLADGFTSEVCLALPAWLADLAAAIDEALVFLFDYGVSRREYYASDRGDGWLRCHFRHHAHNDPLILPGIQDLTTWVDFTAVADAAVASGFDIAGFTAQAHFLLAGGLQAEMANFAELPLERQLALSQQIKTLTLPGEMGERFKCMALSKGQIDIPAAFSRGDRTHTL